MTTIAYTYGVVAYDSRATQGYLIGSDKVDKCLRVEKHQFILAGTVPDMERFVREFLDGTNKAEYDCGGFMVDPDGVLYKVGSAPDEQWRQRWDTSLCMAVGSGRDFAIAAMDHGKTAVEAVKYAMTRDCATGGRVRTVRVTL